MKKVKVMHFVSGLVSGGVEEMLCNYCKHMDSEKYEFIVVYQHAPVDVCKKKIEASGCRTIRITARNENFFRNIIDSIEVIKSERPDIVHAHMNLMNFCALYAARRNKVSVRISHSHIAEKDKSFMFNIMAAICKKLCVNFSTALFTCGLEAGNYLYGKKLMSTGQVRLVENAIDLTYFKRNEKVRKEIRDKYNLNSNFVVGHVGRFSHQKNHERLLKIFYELLKLKDDSILLLIGTGELFDDIKKQVGLLGIENKVIFLGTTDEMNKMYNMMDVFVLPSRFEGFPVVSIEVQAAELPAVFSDTIAPTCKITDSIEFMSLNQSDDEWAKKILFVAENKADSNLEKLYQKFDIKMKALELNEYYEYELSKNL